MQKKDAADATRTGYRLRIRETAASSNAGVMEDAGAGTNSMTKMPATARRRRLGYAMWGVVCLLVSLVGFWPSYVAPLAAGTYQSPSPVMPWHVLSTALWLGLIISQGAVLDVSGSRRPWGQVPFGENGPSDLGPSAP
jgi:hypothetical protein